jgi:hypothetical protein
MRIQASYMARRYAFFSVDSLHFVSSIVDQLATVVAGIHVGDMTPCGQAADHTTARSQLRRVRETYCTAGPQHVGCTPGTVCLALTSPRELAWQPGIDLGHCVSPPHILELEWHPKLPPADLPSFLCAFPNM